MNNSRNSNTNKHNKHNSSLASSGRPSPSGPSARRRLGAAGNKVDVQFNVETNMRYGTSTATPTQYYRYYG